MYENISAIYGHEPLRGDEFPFSYAVGVDSVTKIEYVEKSYGTYGIGEFRVHKDNALFATVNHIAVAEIRFFQNHLAN